MSRNSAIIGIANGLGKPTMMRSGRMSWCFARDLATDTLVVIHEQVSGYVPISPPITCESDTQLEGANEHIGVPVGVAAAMFTGSMWGWDVPGADPTTYDENGEWKR